MLVLDQCLHFIVTTLQVLVASLEVSSQAAASSGTSYLLSARKARQCKAFQTSSQRYCSSHVCTRHCFAFPFVECAETTPCHVCARQSRTSLSAMLPSNVVLPYSCARLLICWELTQICNLSLTASLLSATALSASFVMGTLSLSGARGRSQPCQSQTLTKQREAKGNDLKWP